MASRQFGERFAEEDKEILQTPSLQDTQLETPSRLKSVGAMEPHVKEIVEMLENHTEDIVLTGEAGVGKTWIANEVCRHAEKNGKCYATVWISLDREHDEASLYESIVCQLSTSADVWQDYGKDKGEQESTVEGLRQQIKEKLDEEMETKNYLLLVLDGEGNKMKKEDILFRLRLEAVLDRKRFKVLRTRRESESITEEAVIEVKPLLGREAAKLLEKSVGKMYSASSGLRTLREAVEKQNNVLPTDIIMLSGALNCIAEQNVGATKLDDAMIAAANSLTEFLRGQLAKQVAGVSKLVAPLKAAPNGPTKFLHSAFEVLEANGMIDCFWHSRELLCQRSDVHYNELITHWILEGFFNPVDHLGKAYEKGHHILMKLVDYGILRMQEDSTVVLEGLKLDMKGEPTHGYFGKANLRLAAVLKNVNPRGLGRVAPADGMIKTLRVGKQMEMVTTLLVDGSQLYKENPKAFFQACPNVQVLGIFDSTITNAPFHECKMEKLLVLVLRNCHLLKDLGYVQKLVNLTALEISGAPFLKEMPGGLFQGMCQLQSLNLSELGIKSLPGISNLAGLCRLILRGCSYLRALPSVRELSRLEVIDISECSSLEKMADMSLGRLQKLQILDFSHTKILKLPIIHPLKNLKQLLLKGCDNLTLLRGMKHCSILKILDLSGANKIKELKRDLFEGAENLCVLKLKDCTQIRKIPSLTRNLESLDLSNASSLKDFGDSSFEHLECLHYLNLSNTGVEKLPSIKDLHRLQQLLLQGCSLLESLPEMEGLFGLKVLKLSGCEKLSELPKLTDLQNLEDLDLSGCKALSEIPDNSFQSLTQLQKLKLSGCKKLTKLPNLTGLRNLKDLDLSGCEALSEIPENSFQSLILLQKLKLSGCKKLTKLPYLMGLQNLENLDLSGCEAVSEIQDSFFKQMSRLQKLNLSETQINFLPSLCKPSNLRALVLRNCKNLKHLPDLKLLSELQKLDLFGATNLSEVEAGFLNHLTQLQVLGLSNVTAEKFPSISILTKLKGLSLDGCPGIKKESWQALTGLEMLELSGTGITNLPDEFSEMLHLRRLYLPNLKLIQEFGWEKVKRLPGDLDWEQCNVSELSLVDTDASKPYVMMHGTEFFKRLKDRNLLGNASKLFKQVIFSVRPFKMQVKDMDYYQRNFSNVYFQIRDFPNRGEGQCLEIQGFDDYPFGIEDVLKQAECVSLVENKFLSCISDLHSENLKSMKSCWLERCTEVKSIYEDPNTDLIPEEKMEFAENLEILRISSLPKLRSFYEGKVQPFKNMKELYIDYCPMLETVFSWNQILENLETLQIKFCGILTTVFGQSTAPDGSGQIASASKLKHLSICHCTVLETIYSSPLLPKELETVKIEFCYKLQSVFGSGESATSELLKVSKLYLSELPELRTIGVKLPTCVPPAWKVINCPKLLMSENSEPTNASEEITEVSDH